MATVTLPAGTVQAKSARIRVAGAQMATRSVTISLTCNGRSHMLRVPKSIKGVFGPSALSKVQKVAEADGVAQLTVRIQRPASRQARDQLAGLMRKAHAAMAALKGAQGRIEDSAVDDLLDPAGDQEEQQQQAG